MNILLRKFCVICLKIRCELGVELLGTTGRLISSGGGTGSVKMADSDFKSCLMSEYIDVTAVETHVIKYGNIRSLESRQKEQQYLILIIPGNPGVPEYYLQFMHTLWKKSGEKIPVWCVGHAGHVTGPKHSALGWTDIVRHPGRAYTLEGQITHKVDFIKDNIPADVKLILIGHSIGCYMILNLLPRIPQFHIMRCFMLFPTIERMAETPHGRILTPALNYFRWVFTGFVKALSYLGPKLHRQVVKFYFWDRSIPECAVQASMNLFNPACVNHALFLAKMEMVVVRELQEELLRKYIDKMSFYYGSVDHWCPKEYCYAMQAKFPEADIRLCQMDFSHAFVLESEPGEKMAHTVWEWVLAHL